MTGGEIALLGVALLYAFCAGREVGLMEGDRSLERVVDEVIKVLNEEVPLEIRKRISNALIQRTQ